MVIWGDVNAIPEIRKGQGTSHVRGVLCHDGHLLVFQEHLWTFVFEPRSKWQAPYSANDRRPLSTT